MKIRILPEAERDDDIDGLLKHGGVHATYRGFHRAMSHRFPFAIFYDLNGGFIGPEDPDTRVASYRVASRWSLRPSLRPVARQPTGASSCTYTMTGTSSRDG